MDHNTVDVDTTTQPATLTFADPFNAAVAFIDRHVADGRSDRVAIRDGDGDTTYGELLEQVNRAGNALIDLGLHPGDRVVMVIKDCPAFFFVFWGAIKAGFVPVPINTLLRSNDFKYMIEDSEAACVLWSREFGAEVEAALGALSLPLPCQMPVDGAGDTFAALAAAADPDLSPAPAAADSDCFWLYTSGSTGPPKGVVHAHRDMVITSQCYGVDVLGITADDVHLSAAKLFFAYGLGNAMTFPLWTGGQSVLFAGRPAPTNMFEHIEHFRPTIYYAVPTMFAQQLNTLNEISPNLSSLRACVSAGEPLPGKILEGWRERTGLAILDGIGTTEILHIFIANRDSDVRPGISGKLVPGYEARILDDHGSEVPDGAIGHLWVRGGSVMSRYWKQPKHTAQALSGGWIRTGDSYSRDAEGYFTCHGRSDDMLKVGGIWVSPVEIEARLVAHHAVLEAAVVGRADDDGLVKPEAFVVLKDPAAQPAALAEELKAFCQEGLARYKYPRWVAFVDDLPKTATGKIQRFRLRT